MISVKIAIFEPEKSLRLIISYNLVSKTLKSEPVVAEIQHLKKAEGKYKFFQAFVYEAITQQIGMCPFCNAKKMKLFKQT